MKKTKFENGKSVLEEINKLASKNGAAVTRWAAAKWLSETRIRTRLLKEKRYIESQLLKMENKLNKL